MTPSELKTSVASAGHSPFFFSRDTMAFFGDTMRNYGVRAKPVTIVTCRGESIKAWELFRKRPVRNGLQDPAYFCAETFRRVFGANLLVSSL